MEEKLEAANVDQKRLFLIVFQRFIMILSEHLVRCDTDGLDYDTDWYRWTIGRLQQVFLLVRCIFLIYFAIDSHFLIPFPFNLSHAIPIASRTSAEIQQHIGNPSVHIGSGFAHIGCVPAVCGLTCLTKPPLSFHI